MLYNMHTIIYMSGRLERMNRTNDINMYRFMKQI